MHKLSVLVSAVLLAAFGVVACPAGAELEVTVSISGTLEEILPVLELLRSAGVAASSESGEPPLKWEFHSMSAPVDGFPPAPAPGADEEPATLGLGDASVMPSVARPGDTVLVTVRATDPGRQIDMIGTRWAGPAPGVKAFDLYDDGTHGDRTPRDGVWSAEVPVPAYAEPASVSLKIQAYDAYGEALVLDEAEGDGQPVAAVAQLRVEP